MAEHKITIELTIEEWCELVHAMTYDIICTERDIEQYEAFQTDEWRDKLARLRELKNKLIHSC